MAFMYILISDDSLEGPIKTSFFRAEFVGGKRERTANIWPTASIWSYVAKFEIVFFYIGKNYRHKSIAYTAIEEQWESNSALKVDKRFGTTTGELFFVYTHSASFTPS